MGRVMYDMARESVGYQTEYDIKGYIDDNIHSLDSFVGYPPILGTISESPLAIIRLTLAIAKYFLLAV